MVSVVTCLSMAKSYNVIVIIEIVIKIGFLQESFLSMHHINSTTLIYGKILSHCTITNLQL